MNKNSSEEPPFNFEEGLVAGYQHQRVVVLDTETTGLSPQNGDRIIEVACLELEKGIYPTNNYIHYYINPERRMSQDAFAVHGISDDFLMNKPVFEDISKELWHFIADARLIIHNAPFDLKFLNAEFSRLGYPTIHLNQTIDTLPIARKKYPGAQNNLDGLCQRFKISLDDRDKHGALVDVKLLAAVYVELTQGGRQQSLLQEEKQSNLYQTQSSIIRKSYPSRPSFIHKDLENHDDFIRKNLKTNMWGV